MSHISFRQITRTEVDNPRVREQNKYVDHFIVKTIPKGTLLWNYSEFNNRKHAEYKEVNVHIKGLTNSTNYVEKVSMDFRKNALKPHIKHILDFIYPNENNAENSEGYVDNFTDDEVKNTEANLDRFTYYSLIAHILRLTCLDNIEYTHRTERFTICFSRHTSISKFYYPVPVAGLGVKGDKYNFAIPVIVQKDLRIYYAQSSDYASASAKFKPSNIIHRSDYNKIRNDNYLIYPCKKIAEETNSRCNQTGRSYDPCFDPTQKIFHNINGIKLF